MKTASSLGTFILMEDEHLFGCECSMPHMLVDLDVSEGLPVDMEIIWEKGSIIQKLDYWRVAFCCHTCQETGHSKAACHLCGGSSAAGFNGIFISLKSPTISFIS